MCACFREIMVGTSFCGFTTIPPDFIRILMRDHSLETHDKRLRATVVEATTMSSMEVGMEERPSNSATPRELTQNPLKKIWMPLPCKNGLPEKHISQRKGAYITLPTWLDRKPVVAHARIIHLMYVVYVVKMHFIHS